MDIGTIRLLLVDDHPVVREGLRNLLSEEPDVQCVGEAASGDEAVRLVQETQPDVVLMDLMMPGMDGIQAIRRIRQESPATQVVALTSFGDERKVRGAVEAGAVGYLLKDVLKADLLRAIRNARRGRPSLHPQAQRHLMQRVRRSEQRSVIDGLTPRERSILELIAQGLNNRTIAVTLRLTEGTVKGYVSRVFDKLGVQDRTQAALVAVREGLVDLTEPEP
jgi:DNA-binding NarL/FixJ family response regulator